MKSLSHVLVVPEENCRRCDWITSEKIRDPIIIKDPIGLVS